MLSNRREEQKDDRAIIVGVRCYPDLGDLDGPENDAKEFRNWVRSPEGGYVPEENIELIVSSDYHPPFSSVIDAEPNHARVQRAFDRLRTIAETNSKKGEGLRAGRRLYLYFAGHGFEPRADLVALLTANATHKSPGYHILGKLYANWFFRSGYFDEVVLFMDCCRGSYSNAPLSIPPYIKLTKRDLKADKEKCFYAFGTQSSLIARERTMENGLVHGVFTAALLRGLKGAACEDGKVTGGSLKRYLYNSIKTFLTFEDLEDPDIPREPDINYDPRDGNGIVFAYVCQMVHVTVHLPACVAGKEVRLLGKHFKAVASTIATPPVWSLLLERGLYLVQIVEANSQIDANLQQVFEVSGAERIVNVHL